MEKEEIILNPGCPNKLSVTTWKLTKWWEKGIYCLGCLYLILFSLGFLGLLLGAK